MFGLFRKKTRPTINNPRCAVVSIANHDQDYLTAGEIYSHNFAGVETAVCARVSDLYKSLCEKPVDILHLLARITSDDIIEGDSKAALVTQINLLTPKILIFASDNDPKMLIRFCSGDEIHGRNLVMTLERRGSEFGEFFSKLFGLMLGGRTMPEAWVVLAPQGGAPQAAGPEVIFSAGFGSLMLSASPDQIQS